MKISQSLDQILDSTDVFGEEFYRSFFEQFPEVRKFFDGVNIYRQSVLLTMALIMVEQCYSTPYVATQRYLQYLGTKHQELKIPEEMYPKWKESMIATLRQFHGDAWDEELESQWRVAIERATELMLEGYKKHFTV